VAFLAGAVGTLVLMDRVLRLDSPQTVVAIVGLLATALTSGLGLYFTSRARTASYRDLLYEKQIALVTDMLETMALVDTLCGIILIPETNAATRENAWKELQEQLAHTNLLGARGAALLPDVVYNAFGQYHHVAVRILVDTDAREKNASALLLELRARSAHLMECARALIGVEALSKETQALVADNMLERVGKIDLQHYVALAREADRARHRSE